jgi:hypothetical protein
MCSLGMCMQITATRCPVLSRSVDSKFSRRSRSACPVCVHQINILIGSCNNSRERKNIESGEEEEEEEQDEDEVKEEEVKEKEEEGAHYGGPVGGFFTICSVFITTPDLTLERRDYCNNSREGAEEEGLITTWIMDAHFEHQPQWGRGGRGRLRQTCSCLVENVCIPQCP